MIDKTSSLDDILEHVWETLHQGYIDKKHPYHFPALATYGAQGVQQRTVVLRHVSVSGRTFTCYSDIRTQKVAALHDHPEAHWLFYDANTQEQIRAGGKAILHHQDEAARKAWDAIPPPGRADYIGPVSPGTPSSVYTANLPESFLETSTENNTHQGWENFCMITCEITELDFLKLMKNGHLRTQFFWREDQWKKQWVAP